MTLYAFDANFNILGPAADFPIHAGTVETGAVDLSQIGKVDPVTGISYTLPEKPRNFNVADMPLGQVTPVLTMPLPTTTNAFPQKARATLVGSDQTLTSGAWTKVHWASLAANPVRVGVQLGTVEGTNANALEPIVAGQYIVTGCVTLLAGATTVTVPAVRIKINGTVVETFLSEDTIAVGLHRGILFHAVFDLKARDFVTVEAYCTAAENPLIKLDTSWFSIVQVH